eukprot:CAMPEP_0198294942 /NCGR_PEP_ID=MMETSP1449-20131203/24834_1 /TAXON_ID=420275 /ORGANISM="Attheya septentrionalis, Strain CCMP2084" /LENGTH=271 /DNA_ID=CAMNT_0043995047 /DNA_START=13 /DNA_END=828 /DNA_ORIENTATION=-
MMTAGSNKHGTLATMTTASWMAVLMISLLQSHTGVHGWSVVSRGSTIICGRMSRRQGNHRPAFLEDAVPRRPTLSLSSSTSQGETETKDVVSEETKDVLAQQLLDRIAEVGQIGSVLPQETQEELKQLAAALEPYSDPSPARQQLRGVHHLLYSASPGGSSGALYKDKVVGKVTQTFCNETSFINGVQFLGSLLQIKLYAERNVLDDTRIRVTFLETGIELFGNELVRKPAKGQGVWNHLFYGRVETKTRGTILLRILETPSLFVIEQKIE